MSDAIPEFIAAMEAAGLRPVEPIAQRLAGGELIRFQAEGDGKGKANAWAVLHLDGIPAGAFGNYRMGLSEKWRSGSAERLSPAERRERAKAFRAARVAKAAEQRAGWEKVAAEAAAMLADAAPADPAHPYLVRKRVSGEGLRQRGVNLLVPMLDAEGKVWNVQRIDRDGVKRFLKGGRTEGLFLVIGEPDGVLCIGEGFSTMAAVRRATGHAVVVAFSAKNLEPVARAVAMRWPDLDLIVCADDDAHLVDHPHIKRNLGLDAAHAAALAVGARVAVPPRGEGL